jgi:hypothetical protein
MGRWEETFTSWAKGPGITEQDKCENAETAVRKAIANHERLAALDIKVIPQGSYKNRTNVRQDSDVDICVRLAFPFFATYPEAKTNSDFGNVDGSMSFSDYRNLVGEALVDYFGEESVTRGNKAFDIHENTYRIDADVVAALERRLYTGRMNDDGTHHYLSGIAFNSDTGKHITNWPEQNYDEGLAKHNATGKRFRKVIRILKRLRNVMDGDKIASADGVASCLIEALVWNVPDDDFGDDTLTADLRHVLAYIFNNTRKDEECAKWTEVNAIKYLFRAQQPWTRERAHSFVSAAWGYVGFK